MKLLDSTVLIDILKGKERAKKIIEDGSPKYTTQINVYEIIRGLILHKISSSKMTLPRQMSGVSCC